MGNTISPPSRFNVIKTFISDHGMFSAKTKKLKYSLFKRLSVRAVIKFI